MGFEPWLDSIRLTLLDGPEFNLDRVSGSVMAGLWGITKKGHDITTYSCLLPSALNTAVLYVPRLQGFRVCFGINLGLRAGEGVGFRVFRLVLAVQGDFKLHISQARPCIYNVNHNLSC